MTSSAMLSIRSPGGSTMPLQAQWIERVAHRPVLVLTELPGHQFWWGVPAAVVQAVDQARTVLEPDAQRWTETVVLGRRWVLGGHGELAEFRLTLGPDGSTTVGGAPRALSGEETARALAALRCVDRSGPARR